MTVPDLARFRLSTQRITGGHFSTPSAAVRWMGAVQAQDYQAALWGMGLRTRSATVYSVEQAIANKEIVRTWPMRGTLHFVPSEDVHSMLSYLAPRVVAGASTRYRQLGLDVTTFAKSKRIIVKALEGGSWMTRDTLYALLEKNGISCKGQRGIHIIGRLAHDGILCFGKRDGNQQSFVLLDEWIAQTRAQTREAWLTKFAFRYFRSHGPATVHDFAWWSGLSVGETREILESIKSKLVSETLGDRTYWFFNERETDIRGTLRAAFLPAFDEYLVGYTDRSAAIARRHANRMHPGGGILNPTVVVDGTIVATWKRAVKKEGVHVTVHVFDRLKKSQRNAIQEAAERYGRFVGKSVILQVRN